MDLKVSEMWQALQRSRNVIGAYGVGKNRAGRWKDFLFCHHNDS
jgi:hypothetical protein